jgi:hypothetical protein
VTIFSTVRWLPFNRDTWRIKPEDLEAGKLADLAVLSQDIFRVPLETIGKTRVITTMVGGKIVYSAPP